MTALITITHPSGEAHKLECHDVVRTPGGRIGAIVGFYRRQAESVLVRFGADDCTEFLSADVEPCGRPAAGPRTWLGWD